MRNLIHELRCRLFHRKYRADQQYELARMPVGGLKPKPALWRVWTYCAKCGRGWTKMVVQKERTCEAKDKKHHTINGGPYDLPVIPDCSFHTVDGQNPREV